MQSVLMDERCECIFVLYNSQKSLDFRSLAELLMMDGL
jgi:hypothetical protein